MIKENPFHKNYDHSTDVVLVDQALKGDKDSLDNLIKRNQGYIFNAALKMFNSIEDAEDATQEILIKIITSLGKYDKSKSQFRTWLYRMVVNHFLDFKKTKYEKAIRNFTDFFDAITAVPETDLGDEYEKRKNVIIDEAKVSCMAGMLMCLDRVQRLIYIIGEIFEIDHTIAGKIFNVTPANFRQKLSRTRKDLYHWMNNQCGLVNSNNACRCHKKTKGFIANGWVNPESMKWHSDYKFKIYQLSHQRIDELATAWDDVYANLYREHPFKNHDSASLLDKILTNKTISESLNLN